MAAESTSGQLIEIEVVLGLAPAFPIDRSALETAALELEQAFERHAIAPADGASASANLEAGTLEIDVLLAGRTMAELFERAALIVAGLERYFADPAPAPSHQARFLPGFAIQGSRMRRVTPAPEALLA